MTFHVFRSKEFLYHILRNNNRSNNFFILNVINITIIIISNKFYLKGYN